MKRTILIIEDDAELAELLKYHLERSGDYRVDLALTGQAGLDVLRQRVPNLLILDVNLPEMSGFELCRKIRTEATTSHLPIILLTARTSEPDKVLGLTLGADDYVTKPFSLRELEARIQALLRRVEGATVGSVYDDGVLSVDHKNFLVKVAGVEVKLTRKEFALLSLLVQSRGRTLTRDYLLDRIWGLQYYGDSRTLDVHIRNLRRKLGRSDCIETVVGIGYRFRPPGREPSSER
jgi:two-component system alkaline phosphatase synthesis response regulator PhoP